MRTEFDYARYAFSLLQVLNPGWLRISVVVPNYNYQRYLAQRMESIFAQTVPVFEIIALDDASDDESVAALERLRKTDSADFSIVRNFTNSGSSVKQWLNGIERTSGEPRVGR